MLFVGVLLKKDRRIEWAFVKFEDQKLSTGRAVRDLDEQADAVIPP